MIKLTATATIYSISPVLQVTEKFQKRELVLIDTWERDGNQHHNFVCIDFSGDGMAQLDNFMPGQRVTVEAYVNGREHNRRVFNTIKGRTVTLYQPQQYQQTAPGYTQQPSYPQAAPMPASYPPQYPAQSYPPQQSYRQQSQPGVGELPFKP